MALSREESGCRSGSTPVWSAAAIALMPAASLRLSWGESLNAGCGPEGRGRCLRYSRNCLSAQGPGHFGQEVRTPQSGRRSHPVPCAWLYRGLLAQHVAADEIRNLAITPRSLPCTGLEINSSLPLQYGWPPQK